MADMQNLIILLKQLEDQLNCCTRCGMCQIVCPLYIQTGMESDVARGKLALLDGLLDNCFDDPCGTSLRLNKCLLCGACQANCPSRVNTLEIFLKARVILTEIMGLSFGKRLLLRGMLSQPALFDKLSDLGSKLQKIIAKPANKVVGTSCGRTLSPFIGSRHFIPLAQVPFHRQVQISNTRQENNNLKVVFFVGCLIDKFFPEIAQAVLNVCKFHKVDLLIPENQACCGIPAIAAGDLKTFSNLAKQNIDSFAKLDFDYIITACATCTFSIKKIWPMMLPANSALKKKAEEIAAKTFDISDFLVHKIGLPSTSGRSVLKTVESVTYHDPCHLKKSLGIWQEPRALIKASPQVKFLEMPEADSCCGMGGSFNLQYYNLSAKIGSKKAENIGTVDCSKVLTSCPACMLQLADILSTAKKNIKVNHVIEIYNNSLNFHNE